MVTFACLQVPYYLCNYFPLGLVGEDLAATGLGWLIPGWGPCSDCPCFACSEVFGGRVKFAFWQPSLQSLD